MSEEKNGNQENQQNEKEETSQMFSEIQNT